MTAEQSEKMRSIILPLYDELMEVCRKKTEDCEGCPFGCGYECGLEYLREETDD